MRLWVQLSISYLLTKASHRFHQFSYNVLSFPFIFHHFPILFLAFSYHFLSVPACHCQGSLPRWQGWKWCLLCRIWAGWTDLLLENTKAWVSFGIRCSSDVCDGDGWSTASVGIMRGVLLRLFTGYKHGNKHPQFSYVFINPASIATHSFVKWNCAPKALKIPSRFPHLSAFSTHHF